MDTPHTVLLSTGTLNAALNACLLLYSMPASLTAPDLTTTENVASMRPIMEENVQNNT